MFCGAMEANRRSRFLAGAGIIIASFLAVTVIYAATAVEPKQSSDMRRQLKQRREDFWVKCVRNRTSKTNEKLKERRDDRWSFVNNLTRKKLAHFNRIKQRFYCLLKHYPVQFDHDPKEVPDGPRHNTFAEQFQDAGEHPTCAFVSHSEGFMNVTQFYSFGAEIDAHDIVVRFNKHAVGDGSRGCRTDFRFLNNQFVRKPHWKDFARPRGIFSVGPNVADRGYIMLYNERTNCTKRKDAEAAYRMATKRSRRPVYTLHPRCEMSSDKAWMEFAKHSNYLQTCLWDGEQHRDEFCFKDVNRRFVFTTKHRGRLTKPTLGYEAIWMLMNYCSNLTLYGFASDAFAFGEGMEMHQLSLAEQTLWKIIAARIERVDDHHGNNMIIYHLMGLKDYRELHDLECEPDLMEQFGRFTVKEATAPNMWCEGAQRPWYCARARGAKWCDGP